MSTPTLPSTTRRLAHATTAAGALTVLAVLGPPSAGAVPTTDTPPAVERPCFIEQPHWNVALDGPVPRCPNPPLAQDPPPFSVVPAWADVEPQAGEVLWIGGLSRAQ